MSGSCRPYLGVVALGLGKRIVGLPLLQHVCVFLLERLGVTPAHTAIFAQL